MDFKMFKHLSDDEIGDYRQWARDNYQIYSEIKGIWHPVVQLECVMMNLETGYSPRRDIARQILNEFAK